MLLTGVHASPSDRERFRNEAKAAATLCHPQIVPVHSWGDHEELPYFCMELVARGSLSRRIDHFRTHPVKAAKLIQKLALTPTCRAVNSRSPTWAKLPHGRIR